MSERWQGRLVDGCTLEVVLDSRSRTDRAVLSVVSNRLDDGRLQVDITAAGFAAQDALRLRWTVPCIDGVALWTPRADGERWLPVSFSDEYEVSAISGAPVGALVAADGTNRLTGALSETVRTVVLKFGVAAATAEFVGQARIPLREEPSYAISLLLDTRPLGLVRALGLVADWWAQRGDEPLTAPVLGAMPMYSTWYSFGQQIDSAAVEEQARLAKEIGCSAVIVDDGWQTAGTTGGYASCGDWKPDPGKFPRMEEHVARVHGLGMRYLLWFALPFVGEGSRAYARFADKTLAYREDLDTWVLDPRHPDVREYLIETISGAVTDWHLDGVKIDFIDSFAVVGGAGAAPPGSDFMRVEDAVDVLLEALVATLRAAEPDLLIEFRQSYVGPRLRRYCNLLRVTDCAMDATENRVHALDLRLLAGPTVVHSDMVMWHPRASPQVAARQLLDVLFAVPQISMRLEQLTRDQTDMLRFWLGLFGRFRGALLEGDLVLNAPDLSYPEARADGGAQSVLVTFHSAFLDVTGGLQSETLLVNGSPKDALVLRGATALGDFDVDVFDAAGARREAGTVRIGPEPVTLAVPASGVAILTRR